MISATVTLVDNTAPEAICRDITVNLSDGSFDATELNNGSTDADGDTLTFTIGTEGGPTSQAVTCNDVGTPLNVTLFVSDGNGGTDTCAATVTVLDDVDPTLTVASGVVPIQLDATGNATLNTSVGGGLVTAASDNCGGTVTVTANPATVSCATRGPRAVILTASDGVNTTQQTVNINVADATPPSITGNASPADVVLGTDGTAVVNPALLATATDICGAPSLSASPASVSCANLGDQTIRVTATDSSGLTAFVDVVINVVDNTDPTITAVSGIVPIILSAGGSAVIDAEALVASSDDNCDGVTVTAEPATVDCDNLGQQTIILTATDSSGREAQASATIDVIDQPTITAVSAPAPIVLGADGTATVDAASLVASAAAFCGTPTVTASPATVNCTNAGQTVQVTLTATSASGETAQAIVGVSVVDQTDPTATFATETIQLVLNASGVATLTEGQAVLSAADNCGTPSIALSDASFGCADVGATVSVDVTVTDASGNDIAGSVTVEVLDNADPVAVAKDITVNIGEDAAAVVITAEQIDDGSSDVCGVELSIDVDTFSCLNIGPNTVTLTATDPSGRINTATATVTVTNTSNSCTPEGEGEGDGDVDGEGEGEGVVEEVCVDTDGNGIPDNAFTCLLAGDSNQVIQEGVDGGCLVNTVTVAFSNTGQGGNVVLNNIADPNNNEISFTVSFPVDSIAEGSDGVVVFQIGCDLENLLRGDDSATTLFGNLALGNVPVDEQIDGSPYISVNVIENGLSKIERLDAAVTVTMNGSDANTVEDPTLFVHGAEAVDASPAPGDQIAIQGEASCAPAASCWQPVDGAVSAGAVVSATISSGNVALFTQPDPQVPFLKVSPNPAFDRIFGFVAPNTTSAPANFTLTNIGPGLVTGTATITSQTPALSSAFSIVAATSNTNYNLGPDGSAPVNVTFRPALAGVNYTAVLSLTNTSVPEGSPNRVVEITLRGTGGNGAAKGGILGCGMTDQGGFGFADGALVLLVLMALALGGRAYGKVRQH